MNRIDRVIAGAPLNREEIVGNEGGVTAEQLYTNQKVLDLVSKAEMEQADYRDNRHPNVFFGPVKQYFGASIPLLWFNSAVMILSSWTIFVILFFILRRQIRETRT
jgi:hypothetical protein